MSALSWTPVRNGKLYCSAACGGKCTHAAYLTAKRRAAALVKSLGPGWKPEVWENLGWHFAAINGAMRVSGGEKISPRSRKLSWTAVWNNPEGTGGYFGLSYMASDYTPRGAVTMVLGKMRVTRDTLHTVILKHKLAETPNAKAL